MKGTAYEVWARSWTSQLYRHNCILKFTKAHLAHNYIQTAYESLKVFIGLLFHINYRLLVRLCNAGEVVKNVFDCKFHSNSRSFITPIN